MRKYYRILVAVLLLLASGAMLGYAAFPVGSKGSSVPSYEAVRGSSNSTESTVSETVVSENHSTVASPLAEKHKKTTNKSQVVALILCALIGGLGIHRFYLGYTWQGVVQLLTAGGCGIWALIDLIRIITGDLKPKDGDYGKTL